MSLLFPNHSFLSPVFKHNELPLYVTDEFVFFRCVKFQNSLYGQTVSHLHNGNLRTNKNDGRHSKLFPKEKISYWADSITTARAETKKHNKGNNLLTFWAYDDATSTFPTIRDTERLFIIDGISLGFSDILDKIENGKSLSLYDNELIERISNEKPDCLAYASHVKEGAVNFLFFEKGFYKLSLREVQLRLGDNLAQNTNRIICAGTSDYSPYPENYGMRFEPIARVHMDEIYLQSEEYRIRMSTYENSLKAAREQPLEKWGK